jgi:hypothetical protein
METSLSLIEQWLKWSFVINVEELSRKLFEVSQLRTTVNVAVCFKLSWSVQGDLSLRTLVNVSVRFKLA